MAASLQATVPTTLGSLAPYIHGGSLVLLDDGTAETIAAAAGIKLLSDMGAVSVGTLASTSLHRDLSAAAALAGSKLSSLTIIISSLLGPAEPILVAASRAAMAYTSTIAIACGVSEAAHHDELPSFYSPTCYADFSNALRHQLQPRRPLHIHVQFCPLFTIPLGEFAFVLPAASAPSGAIMASGRPLGYASAVQASADSDDEDDMTQSAGPGGSAGKSQHGAEKAHGVAVLAHALASIASSLGVRPEAFCLGPAAVAVGKSLSFVASSDAAPAAFLLVDRGIDLTTPLLHSDLLMQRAWEVLLAEEEESKNMSNGCSTAHVTVRMPTSESDSEKLEQQESQNFLPGSLFHPQDPQTTSHLGFILTRPGKDAAMFLRKWLREAARKEGVPAALLRSAKPGAIGAAELRTLAHVLATSPAATANPHCGPSPLIQLTEAAVAALEEAPAAVWEALSREERVLLMACTEGSEPACEQLIDLFAAAGRGGGPVGLPQAVGLLLIAYQVIPEHLPWYAGGGGSGGSGSGSVFGRGRAGGSSSGGGGSAAFSAEHEVRLRSAVADAVLACSERWAQSADPLAAATRDAPWLPQELLQRLANGAGVVEDAGERRAVLLEIRDAAEELFMRLRELSFLRQKALAGENGIGRGGADTPIHDFSHRDGVENHFQSFLVRLAAPVADRTEIKGLKHANTSLAGLLKSGLGRFGLQKQPKPGDYKLVVIFVIGGVSLSEVHEVLACVDAKSVAVAAAAAARQTGDGSSVPLEGGQALPQPPPKVIIGGTALLQPRDVVARALSSLH